MRRVVLLLVVVAVVLALAAGVASAVNKTCSGTTTPDCVGTREADTLTATDSNAHHIAGMEGNDIITAGMDGDTIYGDEGNDTITDNESDISDFDRIYGDEGNVTIDVQEGRQDEDIVSCGPGKKDKVFFDEGFDTVTGCEIKNPGQ